MRTSGGAPVPDSPGNTVVFRICADPSCTGGGDPLWTETWNSGTSIVDTKSGLFNVVLGTHNPITLPFDQQYYLEINFNSDGPMTPRQPLTMAPYAFNAKNIELLALNLPPALEMYSKREDTKYFQNGTSFKEFEVLLIPRQEGKLTVPGVSIAFFDPVSKRYTQKSSNPIEIMVILRKIRCYRGKDLPD
jgi:hypothetical protein